MTPEKFPGTNVVYRPPEGLEDCADLHVQRTHTEDGEVLLTSKWRPSLEELAALNRGACVTLTVWGASHPPVFVYVPTLGNGSNKELAQ